MSEPEEWIAVSGPRLVSGKAEDTAIPDEILGDPRLSLVAKGLYALALREQGKPINPYEDAVEKVEDLRTAIDELVTAGLVVRLTGRDRLPRSSGSDLRLRRFWWGRGHVRARKWLH